jgi:hypothetical protein
MDEAAAVAEEVGLELSLTYEYRSTIGRPSSPSAMHRVADTQDTPERTVPVLPGNDR